jgi:hypothetical protein
MLVASLSGWIDASVLCGGLVAGGAIAAFFVKFGRAMLRHEIKDVQDSVDSVRTSITPNGGQTNKPGDILQRLTTSVGEVMSQVAEVKTKVERLNGLVDGHLGWHRGYQDGIKGHKE